MLRLILLLIGSVLCLISPGSRCNPGRDLHSGSLLSRPIRRGEALTFRLATQQRQTCVIRVIQYEIDVALSATNGEQVRNADSKTLGTERLLVSSLQSQQFEVAVRAASDDSDQGLFTLSVQCYPLRPVDAEIETAEELLYRSVLADRTDDAQSRRIAVADLQRAVILFKQNQDRFGEIQALTQLGVLYQKLAFFEPALEALRRAEPLSDPDQLDSVPVFRNLSTTAGRLGNDNLQQSFHDRARKVLSASRDRRAQALALYYESVKHRIGGQPDLSVREARRSLAIAEEIGNWRISASNLHSLAEALSARGQYNEALTCARSFLELRIRQRDRAGEAAAHFLLGRIFYSSGQADKSIPCFRQALIIREAEGDIGAAVGAAVELSRVEAHRGNLLASRKWLRHARRTEQLIRSQITSAASRARISDELELTRKQVEAKLFGDRSPGSDERAFLFTDQTYGRNILEEQDPPVPQLSHLRRTLVDRNTLLLLYWLGPQPRVWALSAKHLKTYQLNWPEIKDLAGEYQRLVSARATTVTGESLSSWRERVLASDVKAQQVAQELSRTLLAKPLRESAPKRLLIVAPSVLSQIPFDALPDPAHPGHPLFVKFDVMHLPSASAIAAIGNRAPPPREELLVIRSSPLALPFGEREVRHILTHFTSEKVKFAAAGKVPDMLPLLSRYRIVHIQGHGVVNFSEPGASAIDTGMRLAVDDIRRLKLANDLVVLNGCNTASGRPYSAETVISLANAFLQAGVAQVLATVRDVDDEASAELMEHFYTALRRNHMTPSAALAKARLEIAKNPRWSAPWFWAGYAIHGVERHKWH